jgi:hypothetical protein
MATNHHILEELARERQLDLLDMRRAGGHARGGDGEGELPRGPRVLDGRLSLRRWRRAQAASGESSRGERPSP